MAAFAVYGTVFLILKLLSIGGILMTDQIVLWLIGLSSVAAVLWYFGMYVISCRMMEEQEI